MLQMKERIANKRKGIVRARAKEKKERAKKGSKIKGMAIGKEQQGRAVWPISVFHTTKGNSYTHAIIPNYSAS